MRKPHPRTIKPQGFVTETSDPSEHNVDVWADWVEIRGRTGADRKLGNFRFDLDVLPPREPGCDRFEN